MFLFDKTKRNLSELGRRGLRPCIPLPAGRPQANASKRSLGLYKKPRPIGARLFARACKPGSVVDGHLSRTHVAARLKPPPSGRPGRPCVPFHGVAPDRVYSAVMSPCGGRALISAFPPLRRRKVRSPPFPAKASGFRRKLRSLPCFSFAGKAGGVPWRYISVALVRGFPLAGVTRYPCPVEPGLSSRTGFRRVRAAVWPAAVYSTSNPPGKSIKLLYLRPSRDIIRR